MKDDQKKSPFADLLKDSIAKYPKLGDTISGKVISIESGAIRVDIDGMATGIVRGPELYAESSEFSSLSVGSPVEATVIDQESEFGELELSFRTAGHQRVWDRMITNRDENITITAKVLQANKGGLMMQVDAINGFMPVSQLNPDHYPRVPGGDKSRILEQLRVLVGQTMQVKVIDVNQVDDKLIVSEKAVWEDEQKNVLDAYKVGDIVEGEISALTSFGAFVKFGTGVEGLVHISEIVWQRIDHPKDVLKVGERVRAQIIDLNKSKIYLSMKRLVDDPWKSVKDTYTIGQIVKGEVHKIEPFGLMVKLDDAIHGLAHISEVSDKDISDVKQLKELFAIGGTYNFEIVSIEPAEHRLGLKLEGVKGKPKTKRTKKTAEKTDEAEKTEEPAKAEEVVETVEEKKAA